MTTAIADRRTSLQEIGTDVSGADSTFAALAEHGLTGWNVRTEGTHLADGRPVPGGRAAVADVPGRDTPTILGPVGRSYRPVQTEEFASLLDTLGERSGAKLDVVTALDGGKRVLIAMKMAEPIAIGGFDRVDVSLVALINHTTGANRLSAVPFRVFCANQQPQIIAEGDDLFVLRHTARADERMRDAGRMVAAAGERLATFEASAEAMLGTPLSEREFLSRTARLFPASTDGKAAATRLQNRQDTLRRLFSDEPTQAPIRFTAWGGYQAVIEYLDHYQGTRVTGGGDGAELPTTPAQRRALRSLTGANTATKLAALSAFSPASLN